MAYFGRILGLILAAIMMPSISSRSGCRGPWAYFSIAPGSAPPVVNVTRTEPVDLVPSAALRWDERTGDRPGDCWTGVNATLQFVGEPSADERRLIAERAILWAKTNRLPHADRLADQLRTQTTITERRFSVEPLAAWTLIAGLIVGFFYGLGSIVDWCIAWVRWAVIRPRQLEP